jgi:UDP-N-acetylmuramoylalanine--D-glutamate ligase
MWNDRAEFFAWLADKNILVIGLGILGGSAGAIRFLARHNANITVYDDKKAENFASTITSLSKSANIQYIFEKVESVNISKFDLVIKGPSVKWSHSLVVRAKNINIPVVMETALFVKFAPCMTVGITGTRGKSTTTMLTFKALSEVYKKGVVYIAGNIPDKSAIDLLELVTENDIAVLELSSWQLSGFHELKVSPHIAVVTNIMEDHLNYYTTFDDYLFDKTAVYKYQKLQDKVIISDDYATRYFDCETPKSRNILRVSADSFRSSLIYLKGHHNRLNASLAKSTTLSLISTDLGPRVEEIISQCKPLQSRQQVIWDDTKMVIINDSASTTPSSLVAAIQSHSEYEMIIMVGGNSKNLDFEILRETLHKLCDKVVSVVLLQGTFTEEILQAKIFADINNVVGPFDNFEIAVNRALEIARVQTRKVCVLFSPGATSFAEFNNEFHRGEVFEDLVYDIMKE